VDGKDGFSERGVTCYPRETNVFVAGKRKTATGRKERGVEIKDESVLVQRGRFRFVPNKGIKPQGEIISEQWGHSPTTPSARQLGPIRNWMAVDRGLSPTGHSSKHIPTVAGLRGGGGTRKSRIVPV
jgi:hypothetical protein